MSRGVDWGKAHVYEVIALLGGAAAWPLGARAQQQSMPVVGFLASGSSAPWTHYVAGFHRGLAETGFTDGQSVSIEYLKTAKTLGLTVPDKLLVAADEVIE